ncbi:MAG: alpha/beta fold hydrolase [Gammaproteobacteria bacterium]|nr:alpha/beta fold hydrolase [Gammaproteobacteria bacterium]
MVLLHGWGDTGASFQFIAPFLAPHFHLIAPDLRGFGQSRAPAGEYWFPDYLADLDALLAALCGERPCDLVGHSMGGNIAGLYAGIRPERIRKLVLLEGFGLDTTSPGGAPSRYREWLDAQQREPRLREFSSQAALREHLRRLAPFASDEILEALCPLWAQPAGDGRWRLRMDPRHRWPNPVLCRRAEAIACWQEIRAPVLLFLGDRSEWPRHFVNLDPLAAFTAVLPAARVETITEAGHMLHWEQPARLGRLLRDFFLDPELV